MPPPMAIHNLMLKWKRHITNGDISAEVIDVIVKINNNPVNKLTLFLKHAANDISVFIHDQEMMINFLMLTQPNSN